MFRISGKKFKYIYKYLYPNMNTYINGPFKGEEVRTTWSVGVVRLVSLHTDICKTWERLVNLLRLPFSGSYRHTIFL